MVPAGCHMTLRSAIHRCLSNTAWTAALPPPTWEPSPCGPTTTVRTALVRGGMTFKAAILADRLRVVVDADGNIDWPARHTVLLSACTEIVQHAFLVCGLEQGPKTILINMQLCPLGALVEFLFFCPLPGYEPGTSRFPMELLPLNR